MKEFNARDRIIEVAGKLANGKQSRGGIRELARRIGISHTRVNQILEGDRITYDMAVLMAPVLKCSWKSLCEEKSPKNDSAI